MTLDAAVDVAIVGAGPAGTTLAAHLARRGELRAFDAERVAAHATLDVQTVQHRGDHLHVFGARTAHVDLSAGDGGNHRPAACFDIVAT